MALGRIKGRLRPFVDSHLLSAQTRPEILLKNSLSNNFLWGFCRLPLAGWSSHCVQPSQGREPGCPHRSRVPGCLHWVGSPFQGQVDSPLGPVASDLRDKPHHAKRLLLPNSSAQGCGPVVTPALSSLCVPFFSSFLLVYGGNIQPALT